MKLTTITSLPGLALLCAITLTASGCDDTSYHSETARPAPEAEPEPPTPDTPIPEPSVEPPEPPTEPVPSPCIEVSPGVLDFGFVPLGNLARRTVEVHNCSETTPIDLMDVSLVNQQQGFELGNPPEPGHTLAPGASYGLNVFFSSDSIGQWVGTLRIETSNEQLEPLMVAMAADVPSPSPQPEGIHVELTWQDDGDLDGQSGNDLDLHFLHQSGRWDQSPYDCYWRNIAPNWGNTQNTGDDPSLNIDDVDGWGPESISLERPESLSYKVGVLFKSNRENTENTAATIRIYIDGALTFEKRDKTLLDRQFWEVASITWGEEPTIEPIDAVYDTIDDAP